MALETERCSPSNAASPGPTTGRRPGSQGTASAPDKPKSAFHQIALLTRCASPPAEPVDCHRKLSVPRPPSAESSSNSVQRPPYSDSSPPSSPPGPQSPDHLNGFPYHPDMASLSLVYGLGVVPSRFPLGLHLPTVYPSPEPFSVLPRVATVVPVKPPDLLGALVARHLPDSPGFAESRLLGVSKPQLTPKATEAIAPRCNCCLSPSPRSPSPRQPPGPSSLTFSVDNILRPDFGRCRAQQRRVRAPKSVKTAEVEPPKTPQVAAAVEKPATPARSTTPASDDKDANGQVWPAWVYCTRYSDRPSSGPRSRRMKRKEKRPEEKRPRTAFSGEQLARLKSEFNESRYLTEKRRQELAIELGLNEAQIKIWFQNKRAKIKKATGMKNPLALQLMAQGLYNHSTVALSDEEDESESSGPRQ